MEIYRREKYLTKIRPFYNDVSMIKVIVGVRRCGKSCIMQTIATELIEQGVSEKNVVYLDLDSKNFRNLKTSDELEKVIDEKAILAEEMTQAQKVAQTQSAMQAENTTRKKDIKYLFIDEIQNIKDFEPLINAYRNEGDWSIFITGSNAYLLSGELATKLTGRYLEFEIFTLDFKEYLDMKQMFGACTDNKASTNISSTTGANINFNIETNNNLRFGGNLNTNIDNEFATYIQLGGFPGAIFYETFDQKRRYIKSIVEEIFAKDIKFRMKIKHVSVFNTVRDYLINNFGAAACITNLLNFFNNQMKIPIKRETLNRYIQILVDAKILYRCQRFDMKSRKSLQREEKYYLSDLGFYFALNTDNRINFGPELENITYLYARSRDYAVSVGRIGKLECDFVLRKNANEYAYVQVSRTIADEKTEEREYAPLEKIPDNYPKHVLRMDRLLQKRNGITHENIVDFMLGEFEFY